MKTPDYRISRLAPATSGFGASGTARVIEHMKYIVSTRPVSLVLTFKRNKRGETRLVVADTSPDYSAYINRGRS